MSSRRDAVLDAAITVLGEGGARTLTHRAVDAAAGAPAGTTSNHFRTRQALLEGIAARLVERDLADSARLGAADPPATVDELVGLAVAWLRYSIGPDRVRTAARYSLFLESASDERLQAPLRSARDGLLSWAAGMLTPFVDDPGAAAELVTDWADGVVLHQLCMPRADFDPRADAERIVRAVLR